MPTVCQRAAFNVPAFASREIEIQLQKVETQGAVLVGAGDFHEKTVKGEFGGT
jgi:hypothetical protein